MKLSSVCQSLLILTLFSDSTTLALDWPMFRGPDHDGISRETEWKKQWPESGPITLWEAQVGIGFSSVSVADGCALTLGHQDDQDTLYALDSLTGAVKWQHSYPSKLGDKFYEGGPGSTPTIDGGRVYSISKWGDLFCLEASTGKVIWQRQLEKEEGLTLPDWGFNGSPLILGDKLILNIGGAGMTLDKSSGKTLWLSNQEAGGYSTPLPFVMGNTQLIALSNETHFTGVEVETGTQRWEIKWPTRYGVNAADPIILGDEIWIGSGYGKGHGLFRIQGGEVSEIWTNRELRAQQNAPVLIKDHLYGFDGDGGSRAALKCIERSTGKVAWEADSFKYGALSAAGDHLIILSAQGELITAPASPSSFEPLSRAQILDGKCWIVPVLANGLLYARNSQGHLVCVDLRP